MLRTKALAHLEMMRPYTVFHAGLLAVAGAELASIGSVPPWRVALAALVTMCGWEAGLYAGDYHDREIDAHSKPTRPIPSGRVSPREALATMLALIAAGYLCALALGPANLGLAVLTTALGIAYSRVFKMRALLGNFDRGVLGACAVLFGALAAGGTPRAVLALAALACCHDAATNLVGALRDVDGDRAAGCLTVPVVYGVDRAARIACALALVAVAIGALLLASFPHPALSVFLFLCAALLAAAAYGPLWIARAAISRRRALAAHKILVAERLILLSAFIAAYAPPAATLVLLAVALVATLGSQRLLRDRYEPQAPAMPSLSIPSHGW